MRGRVIVRIVFGHLPYDLGIYQEWEITWDRQFNPKVPGYSHNQVTFPPYFLCTSHLYIAPPPHRNYRWLMLIWKKLVVSYKWLKPCIDPPLGLAVKKAVFNHLIISPLCLVWVRVPHWAHVRQAKFCFQVCQLVFLWNLSFPPTDWPVSHLLIGLSHTCMSWHNLERDVKVNKK